MHGFKNLHVIIVLQMVLLGPGGNQTFQVVHFRALYTAICALYVLTIFTTKPLACLFICSLTYKNETMHVLLAPSLHDFKISYFKIFRR